MQNCRRGLAVRAGLSVYRYIATKSSRHRRWAQPGVAERLRMAMMVMDFPGG
jgi:hypothetical protein